MNRDVGPALPRTALVLADSVRVLGALSILVSAVWFGPVEIALFLLVLLGLLVPRVLVLPLALDLALGTTLLAGGWFAVFDVFEVVGPLDLVVHFVANGLLAVTTYLLLVRFHAVPDPSDGALAHHRTGVVVMTTALGAMLGVLWELGEWAGHTYFDDGINVGYEDTLGDLVSGAAGSLLGGILLVVLATSVHTRTADRSLTKESA
ncbi:hypothetical protein [Sanguibacter antarcticus]|uniref:Uncharacterized protein n=1 Tax=Sanguibacter antarcticus TaxID=372484 RepID=A0A2A9E763_9MICO|nr:hypothetical protein [Sanguibacter antarcticus]PFG34788.1 hypothetical protein ATL42_2711 [Sanguibacter antarcticus]